MQGVSLVFNKTGLRPHEQTSELYFIGQGAPDAPDFAYLCGAERGETAYVLRRTVVVYKPKDLNLDWSPCFL